MQKTILTVVAIAIVIAGAWHLLSSKGRSGNSPVAVVNGETLTRSDLDAVITQVAREQGTDVSTLETAAKAQLETQSIDVLISQTLLRQAVVRSGVEITDAMVDEQMTTIKSQFGDDAAFQAALKTEGLTESKLREEIKKDLALQSYLNSELALNTLTATDEEIQTAYDQAIVGTENAPALTEVRDQVKDLVVNQKQQTLVAQLIQSLRAEATVEVLI
jgi:hypothetical protein